MNNKEMITRTSLFVRFCHFIVVILFTLTALSGLSFFFPSLKIFGWFLGTPQLARELHPILGCIIFVLLMIMMLKLACHNIPNKHDIRWLKSIKQILGGKEPEGVPVGKYNAGQKFLFWCIMALIIVLMVTGIIMWRRHFSDYFSIEVIRIAILFHSLAAIALILLIMGHIYMAIWVKGTLQSMISGKVPRAWARKNHNQWYAEEMEKSYQEEYNTISQSQNKQEHIAP